MSRKIAASLALAAVVAASTALAARRQATQWRDAGGPPQLPLALHREPEPAAWVFVRRGCRHCALHLRALEAAAHALPDSQRLRLLRRIHLVGDAMAAPSGVVHEPDSLRQHFRVHLSPTTWLVGADGRIRRAWRGARGRRAWDDAFMFLAREVAP